MKVFKFLQFIKENKSQKEIDRILDKISSNGIDSLTSDERRFLDDDSGAEEVGIDLDSFPGSNYMDEYGNYLDEPVKGNFLLKVVKTPEGGRLEVLAYEKGGKYMIDDHFSDELFPEVKSIGLEDLAEGVMEYIGGKRDVDSLVSKLISMGFNAVKMNTSEY